jgi:hypothetical protein
MKPNPFGFNLNFDEFFGVKAQRLAFETANARELTRKCQGGGLTFGGI